jgi:hypothetical protein
MEEEEEEEEEEMNCKFRLSSIDSALHGPPA